MLHVIVVWACISPADKLNLHGINIASHPLHGTMLPGGMKYSHNTISRPSSVQALMMEVYVHFVQ